MVKADWIKPGAIVIDVGINRLDADLGENPEGLSGTWTLTIIVPLRVQSRQRPAVSVR
jgi:5,10-methylene-tetrahydrofolate dehydrogenase/methenyl tetrahydrofolate cyclohydrolase